MTRTFCDICNREASDHEAIMAAEFTNRSRPLTIHARQYFTTNDREDGPDLCDRCRTFLLHALADSIVGGPRIVQIRLGADGLALVNEHTAGAGAGNAVG